MDMDIQYIKQMEEKNLRKKTQNKTKTSYVWALRATNQNSCLFMHKSACTAQ